MTWSLTNVRHFQVDTTVSYYLLWTTLAAFLSVTILTYSLWPRQSQSSGIRKPTSDASASTMASERVLPPPNHVSVSKILIHPIKSCSGISVQHAKYTPEGLENDRLWCIIDAIKVSVITAREAPKMVLITSSIELDGSLKVTFPEESECAEFSVPLKPTEEILKVWSKLPTITLWPTHDPVDGYICESIVGPEGTPSATLSKFFEKPVHLVYKGPRPRPIDPTATFPQLNATAKYQDMYPLLVLSDESMATVENEIRRYVGTQGIDERWRTQQVLIERFRPNIVIKGGGAFTEDDWEQITIGSKDAPLITLVSKCTRCLLPNVNPETGERDNAVPYKVLMKFRTKLDPTHMMKPCVGCNAVPSGEGTVSVGDRVYVCKMI